MNLFQKQPNTSGYTSIPEAIADDDTAVVLVSTITPSPPTAMTMDRRSSKRMMMAFVAGTMLVLMVAGTGAVWMMQDGSSDTTATKSLVVASTRKKGGNNGSYYTDKKGGKGSVRRTYDCPEYPDIKPGICETKGDVLPYLNHQRIIPGKIYYGLDFTNGIYKGTTWTPHNPSKAGRNRDKCSWGDGKSVGRCILERTGNVPHGDKRCPSTLRQIVDAWQQCAILCNDQPECHTFTVKTQALLGHRDFHCYFHKSYKCQKKNNQYAGIDNYVKREDIRNAKYDDLGVWG